MSILKKAIVVPKPPKIKVRTRVSVWKLLLNYLKKIKKDREDWIDELKFRKPKGKKRRTR